MEINTIKSKFLPHQAEYLELCPVSDHFSSKRDSLASLSSQDRALG